MLYALGEREEGLARVRRAVEFGGQSAMTSYAGLPLVHPRRRAIPQAIHCLVNALEQTGDAADVEEARRRRARLPSEGVSCEGGGSQPA
ncbi:hypothetical protein ACFYMW_05300 [Streptomyces sp. NPDC006692]|uniref:hypothetical protein n=1 Tax=Streptomyces sp. NPDC006692 TaxID=3364758 RepID=UPI0036C2972C